MRKSIRQRVFECLSGVLFALSLSLSLDLIARPGGVAWARLSDSRRGHHHHYHRRRRLRLRLREHEDEDEIRVHAKKGALD